ncbi:MULTISPECIES: ABC transporter substrate-binding protein [Oceanobacillus]|uniref:ABC transporter substrate-binding protein n=1 Tax=Oceanobacillus aidingensis TaxID=645964 RepID=A0ABV9JUI5_9BACI|nr:ABC transporter substrate-binding protein [Oceanobacillus oncorhynchi]UUI39577.1 ABC transporter substrate-binding protein [Oceanobacillus oncorhynchi]
MKKLLFALITASVLILTACSDASSEGEIDTIVLADAGWDSINVHNYIAAQIMEEGYGYDTDITSGSTAATIQGLSDGDINVYMEVWTDNIRDIYEELTEAGDIETLSVNFDDNNQGLYVPAYVIEGDPERGIEPLAPDLQTVEDLKDYPEVFQDPEDPDKGRIINAPSGWAVEEAINDKFDFYELDETFNNFSPGSDSAIITDLARAYEAGEGWVGYYWSPTAITAKYDLILLEEAPYDEEIWEESKGTEFPPNDVVISVHPDFLEQAPEVVEFLEQYETSSALTEEALEYMEDNGASAEEAAIWWMQEHEDIWTAWLPEDTAQDVVDSLE